MYECMYVCMYVGMYVCIYVCMYACKFLFNVGKKKRNNLKNLVSIRLI